MASYGLVLLSSRDVALTAWLRTASGYGALGLSGKSWRSELREGVYSTQ